MKYFLIILSTLPIYLHNQTYPVTLHQCEMNKIIVEDNKIPFEIQLFNLKIKDEEGWNRTCDILEQANTLEIEIDASTNISEPLPVYLFADQELVQKTLIREERAYTQIHNPEYRYESELLEIEQAASTMAVQSSEATRNEYRSQGWMFLLFLSVAWIVTIIGMLPKRKIRSLFHHKDTSL